MNPSSLEGGEGGRLHVGSGGNNPNITTENEKENENKNKKVTTAVPLSSTEKDDDDGSFSTGITTKKNNKHILLSSSSVSSSSATTGIMTENCSGQKNKNEEAVAAAAATPSSSSSTKTLSEVVEVEIAAAETSSTTITPLCEREECPICFHVLPHRFDLIEYKPCCGRKICYGCIVGRVRAELKEPGKIIEGETLGEEQFNLIGEEGQFSLIRQHWSNLCPFCRHEGAKNDGELLQLLYGRIQKRNDRDYTTALIMLGTASSEGMYGLPENTEKGEELFQEAYDLDDPIAALQLYQLYRSHYSDQKEKQMEFLRRGKTLGNLGCIAILAQIAIRADEHKEATRLLMKVASLGGDTRNLMICYRNKHISKEDLATTLRAHQAANDEINTVRRGFAMQYRQMEVGTAQNRTGCGRTGR